METEGKYCADLAIVLTVFWRQLFSVKEIYSTSSFAPSNARSTSLKDLKVFLLFISKLRKIGT